MAYSKKQLTKLVADLNRERAGLKKKLHRAEAGARREWATLEKKYKKVSIKAVAVKKEVGKTAGAVGNALGKAVHEMKKGYARLRKMA